MTVLVAGLALSVLAGRRTLEMVRSEAETRFIGQADRLIEQIRSHILQAEDGLRGLEAMAKVVPRLSRLDFRTYVGALDLARQFPGIRGFGFIEQVQRNQLDAFLARERADVAPDFEVVSPASPHDLMVVKYVEPRQSNARASGMDIATDPERREAAERAIATGKMSISAPINLVQDASKGWLLFLPVFSEGGPPSSAPKLSGLLYAPISVSELLTHVTAVLPGEVDFRVSDARSGGLVLYDTRSLNGRTDPQSSGLKERSPMFEAARSLDIAGRTFNVQVSSTPRFDADVGQVEGALVALAGTVLTIMLTLAILHLRRRGDQAEATARERERLMRLMTENIPARLSYWDRELRCRLLNRSLAVVFGRPPEEVVGKRLDELLPPDRWQRLAHRVDAALQGAQQQFEWETISMSGEPGTALFYCIPDVRQGQVAGLLLFSIDITQLKEAQQEAQRASEAKSQFLSNMSHEIRTPMNAIFGMLSLLRITALDRQQSEYVIKAESAARSLLGLLDDILDVSKIEAGKMALDAKPFALPDLLQDLELILSATLGEKPVALRVSADPGVPRWLLADDVRLRQILINLGGNAIKFTHAGEVTLRIEHIERRSEAVLLEFSVADSGIGISPQDHRHIFAEFSQASSATTREFGGSGLGLAICSRLIALMGGELQVESSLGQGSRFHFRLWLDVAKPPESVSLQQQPGSGIEGEPLRGYRLLLAEDNLINQEVAREVLKFFGAEVHVAENGREAVQAVAERGPFDAVLMDIQMPVMDGFQATREIRETLRQTQLPIIAVTANVSASDREKSRAAGMVDHVGKPFVPEDLVKVLLHHIEGTNAHLG